jgi:hypothetical protein
MSQTQFIEDSTKQIPQNDLSFISKLHRIRRIIFVMKGPGNQSLLLTFVKFSMNSLIIMIIECLERGITHNATPTATITTTKDSEQTKLAKEKNERKNKNKEEKKQEQEQEQEREQEVEAKSQQRINGKAFSIENEHEEIAEKTTEIEIEVSPKRITRRATRRNKNTKQSNEEIGDKQGIDKQQLSPVKEQNKEKEPLISKRNTRKRQSPANDETLTTYVIV